MGRTIPPRPSACSRRTRSPASASTAPLASCCRPGIGWRRYRNEVRNAAARTWGQTMDVSFEDYRSSWLDSVTEGSPTTVQLGHRFAHKIASQWLDVDDDTLEVTYCDGSGDGGIDILVLDRAGLVNPDEEPEGDTWY